MAQKQLDTAFCCYNIENQVAFGSPWLFKVGDNTYSKPYTFYLDLEELKHSKSFAIYRHLSLNLPYIIVRRYVMQLLKRTK